MFHYVQRGNVFNSNLAEDKMNEQAYLDFRVAQELYLKANGWTWTVLGKRVFWAKKNSPFLLELGEAVVMQVHDDSMMYFGKGLLGRWNR